MAVCIGGVGLILLVGLIVLLCIFCRRKKSSSDEDNESRYEEIIEQPKPSSYEVMDPREDLYSKAAKAQEQRAASPPPLSPLSTTSLEGIAEDTEDAPGYVPSPSPSDHSVSMGHSTDHDDINLISSSNPSETPSMEQGATNPGLDDVQVNPLYGQQVDFQDSAGPTPASTLRTSPQPLVIATEDEDSFDAAGSPIEGPGFSSPRGARSPSDTDIAGFKNGLLRELSGRFPEN